MIDIEKSQAVQAMLEACLYHLVEAGFAAASDFASKQISIRCDMNERLDSLSFFAAASIDDIGRPVLIFNADHSLEALAWVVAHEAVHIAQICKGDWEPFKGYSVWKCRKHNNLAATDPNYFSLSYQPWEAEAKELEEGVRNAIYEKFPYLKIS